ncbi:hypothetical protein FHS15_005171 [Paenibacillus castaneae]|uniref:DUF5412 family protein n=1 Tax=Paenibacillus castaneae TaxID=474957 RepID=UPI001ABB3FF4|nr:DUF5412 family protein [Paenibacillus castaneae]NIK79987.1 hypothetical protein [Paenibacillus castaneae]
MQPYSNWFRYLNCKEYENTSTGGTIINYLYLLGFFILSLITVLIFFIFCIKLFVFYIKKKPFPKKLLIAALIGIGIVTTQVIYNTYFFTFDNLEGEFYKGPVESPTDKYTANAYYKTYGGAAGGVNLWVEITYHDDNKMKIVYHSDAKRNFSMEWKNENTLYIVNEEPGYPSSNKSVTLNVEKETYFEGGLVWRIINNQH